MNAPGNKKLLTVPAIVAVVGFLLLIIGLLSGATVKLTQFTSGSTLSMSGGFSVYSPTAADRTATFCTADGKTLPRPTRDFSISADGAKYYEVARSSQDNATVNCSGNAGKLYAGERADKIEGGFQPVGIVLGSLLVVLGILGLIAFLLLGRRKGGAGQDATGPYGSAYGGTGYEGSGYVGYGQQQGGFGDRSDEPTEAITGPPLPTGGGPHGWSTGRETTAARSVRDGQQQGRPNAWILPQPESQNDSEHSDGQNGEQH